MGAWGALAERTERLYRTDQVVGWATPGEMARALDPATVQTPALDLLDQALVDVDTGVCDRLIISMPPQEGKSERVTHYGALWMLRRQPNRRLGIVSYGEDIARRMSYAIRNDIIVYNGDEGTVDIGMRLQTDSKAASRWNLAHPNRGGVYAIGIGGSLTGRPLDLLIIDDPVKDYRAADSTLLSELAWQWWMSVARPRLAPGAPVIVVLTRWHEADLAGRMQQKQVEDQLSTLAHFDRWRIINIPAQADHNPTAGSVDPLGREPGEFMRSARGRTAAQWEATKAATTPRIWSALYQGHPSPDTGDVLQRQWWRRYDTPLWSQHPDGSYRMPAGFDVIQSWDMAFKDTKSSDFVVGQVWARQGAEAFLVDQVRARLSFTATTAAVRLLTAKWPQASAKLVEDKANGTAVIDSLKSEVSGIIPVTPHESKYARTSAISPFVEAGNVHLPAAPVALFDVEALIEECAQFPNGANDDQVDTLSQALARLLLQPGEGRAWIEAWRRMAAVPNTDPPPVRSTELASEDTLAPIKPAGTSSCKHRWFAGSCAYCGAVAA